MSPWSRPAQLPAPDAAGEHVHEDRQVDELLPEPDVCDVRDPDLIGAGHLQALDQVRVAGEVVAAVGRPPPAFHGALPAGPSRAITRRTRLPLTDQPSRRSMAVSRR